MLCHELFQQKITEANNRLRLFKNPSIPALLGLLTRTEYGSVRGLIVGPDIWWWDADMALHDDVARRLELVKPWQNNRLILYRTQKGQIRLDFMGWAFDRIMAHPMFSKLAKSPLISFWIAGDDGLTYLRGPEWIEAHTRVF